MRKLLVLLLFCLCNTLCNTFKPFLKIVSKVPRTASQFESNKNMLTNQVENSSSYLELPVRPNSGKSVIEFKQRLQASESERDLDINGESPQIRSTLIFLLRAVIIGLLTGAVVSLFKLSISSSSAFFYEFLAGTV